MQTRKGGSFKAQEFFLRFELEPPPSKGEGSVPIPAFTHLLEKKVPELKKKYSSNHIWQMTPTIQKPRIFGCGCPPWPVGAKTGPDCHSSGGFGGEGGKTTSPPGGWVQTFPPPPCPPFGVFMET